MCINKECSINLKYDVLCAKCTNPKAAIVNSRRYWGLDPDPDYVWMAKVEKEENEKKAKTIIERKIASYEDMHCHIYFLSREEVEMNLNDIIGDVEVDISVLFDSCRVWSDIDTRVLYSDQFDEDGTMWF